MHFAIGLRNVYTTLWAHTRNDITRKVKWSAPVRRLRAGLNVIGKGYIQCGKIRLIVGTHAPAEHVEHMFAVEIESSLEVYIEHDSV